MDFWMISRSDLKDDLMTLFTALDGLQYRYDWVISDTDLYFRPDTPENVKARWLWTGLLMDGAELTGHLESGYVWFVSGGILSAVPKGTKPEDVWNYMPRWDVEDFGSAEYQFQTPLTKLEILCYDGYAYVIVSPPSFSPVVRRQLPAAKTVEEFYAAQD